MGDMFTGEIVSAEEFSKLPTERKARFLEFKRDLTAKEAADMQIRKYSPCMCGSGKKFKFCCWRKAQ